MSGELNIVWAPQPGPQAALIECPAPIIFYGGARGGGKTDGMLGKWALKERRHGEHFNAIMLRKTTVSAEDAVRRSKQIYGPLGGRFNESTKTWRMPNGGTVTFGYLETISDAERYQGQNLTDAWVEEAGQYADPAPIDRLFGALRSASGVPTQLTLTANPGGPGQNWLRDRFKLYPLPSEVQLVDFAIEFFDGRNDKITAAVIPSRLKDNRVLIESDPDYEKKLYLVGNRELVRAWLEGDWSAIEGAYFTEWDSAKHVLKPIPIPDEWTKFRSFDWGSASPFSVGWWAVTGYEFLTQGRRVPKGALIRYREWYGASAPNKGLKLTAEEIAAGIIAREHERIDYGVADPACFAQDGGPSHAERMALAGVVFSPADNKRVTQRGHMGGWDMLRQRLKGQDGKPMLYCFDTCRDSIRTIPVLQHDEKRPEDLDTTQEDHAADDWRYACMSRPWVAELDSEPTTETDAWGRFKGSGETWRTI